MHEIVPNYRRSNMVNIEILRDYTYTNTIVPNEFIDFFMPEANGEFVKV